MTNRQLQIHAIDFHCHVDLAPDPAALIAQCESNRIFVLAVTTTPKAWDQNRLWTQNLTYVHSAVGLHPELVAQRYSEINLLERLIADTRLVGEVGLDGSSQYESSYDKQKEVFVCALKASQKHGGRVMSIHSRKAAKDVIELIVEHTNSERVLPVLHWFSSSKSEALRAIDAGCYFSVNSSMMRSKSGKAILDVMPRNRLLTETDSPFTKVGNRKAEPCDVIRTVDELAGFYNEPVDKMKIQLDTNARHVLSFAGVEI